MKKLIVVLFVMLGVAVKLSAQIKIYNDFEKEVALSNDESKIFYTHHSIKKINVDKDRTHDDSLINHTDTVRIYYVSIIARRFINDSLASLLIDKSLILDPNTRMPIDQSVELSDSLVPRWTHLFGEETYIKRELRIVGDDVLFFNVGTKSGSAVSGSDFFSFLTLAGLWLVFTLSQMFYSKSKKFTLWGSIVLFLMIFLLGLLGLFEMQGHFKSFFDICFLSLIVVVPSLLTLLIPIKKKEGILEKHILKC